MTLAEIRKYLIRLFQEHHIESPETDSGLLLMHRLNLSKTQLLLGTYILTEEEESDMLALANRRIQGEPVRYLTGVCPFMDLDFYVNPSTLIPRPDTELLVEAVSHRLGDRTILWDIGCGSGCVGITLAHLHPSLSVAELDISFEALDTARQTAQRYGLSNRVSFLQHDILKGMPALTPPQVIVSNPPYIPTKDIETLQTEVRFFEPRRALDGGADGLLFYRQIIKHAPLSSHGLLAFEIGFDQGESVPALMREHGYLDIELLHDLSGNPRVVLGYHK
ncbi:MAG: peptide chain release factor N(5)-glutamine methyltransferase [Clostridia bacterium]|nr:peptide chain release factor N(5)-glutamine methyltransferase [Clostridia bacterium]